MLPDFILTRNQYDRLQIRCLRLLGLDDRDARRALERLWPLTTALVLGELVQRGLAPNERQALKWARENHVRQTPGGFYWFPADVELFAEWLAERRQFTRAAMERKLTGVTAALAVTEVLDQPIESQAPLGKMLLDSEPNVAKALNLVGGN